MYLVYFQLDALKGARHAHGGPGGPILARGYATSSNDVVAAIFDWLSGKNVCELHVQHSFVDQSERALQALHDGSKRPHPMLDQFHEQTGDQLWYRNPKNSRSVWVFFYSGRDGFSAEFFWDECEMFMASVDDSQLLSRMLNRWICEEAAPSAMQREFIGVELAAVAPYYEAGNPIEGEFLTSWDGAEEVYRRLNYPLAEKCLTFIAAAREAGYDKKLRAGTSLATFIVSRSRRYGLREEQPSIDFRVYDNGETVVHVCLGHQTREYSLPSIELSPQIMSLLDELAAMPID